jgi:hypothetical protein
LFVFIRLSLPNRAQHGWYVIKDIRRPTEVIAFRRVRSCSVKPPQVHRTYNKNDAKTSIFTLQNKLSTCKNFPLNDLRPKHFLRPLSIPSFVTRALRHFATRHCHFGTTWEPFCPPTHISHLTGGIATDVRVVSELPISSTTEALAHFAPSPFP